jgi:hypothetical protein
VPNVHKKPEPTVPYGPTLHDIEEDAVRDGYEVLFGPHRVRLVRTVVEYAPYPEAGPGRWRVIHRDAMVEAALNAARSGIEPDMLPVLRDSDFASGSLKRRLLKWRKLLKEIHGA